MKKFLVGLSVIGLVFSFSGVAFALDLSNNITIPDLMGSGTGWHGAQEDREVEPGNQTGQKWDLEGFFLDGTTLTAIGGFNFLQGEWGNGKLFESGDIFIDIDGDAKYGPSNSGSGGGYASVNDTFGYDYVFDLNLQNLTYKVYKLVDGSSSVKVWYKQNDESNAFRYNGNGNYVTSGSIAYKSGLTDKEVADLGAELTGGLHNALSVDLSFLEGGTGFTSHLTLGCGNDNLMGAGTTPPVPEPTTLLLLASGLLGVITLGRKKFQK